MRPHWLAGSAWNLLGIGLPFAVAVVTMPLLLAGLGPDRYGLLLLAWSVVGYFSVFDFGLSRAITQLVARTYRTAPAEAAPVVATGTLVLAAFGVAGGALLVLAAPHIDAVGSVPPALRDETVRAVRILGVGLPFVVVSTGLRGALEGVFDFVGTNVIRLVAGIGTYVAPLLVMVSAVRVDWICAGLVLLRVASAWAYWWRCRRHFALGTWRGAADGALARQLLGYGGWITVSNLVSPVMAYLDRFLVAGAISLALTGYYSTTQEILTRMQVVPGAILAVLFPAIARSVATAPERAGELFARGAQYVTWALLPVAAACLLFAHEGLAWWFGPEFADGAATVARLLAIGSFVNCLAQNPFTFLQGIGRPDVTAKLHLLELPLYLAGLWWLTRAYGVVGVALAWTGRVALDLVLLLWAARRASAPMAPWVSRAAWRMALPVAGLAALWWVTPLAARAVAWAAVAAVSALMLVREWRSGTITLVEPAA